jgi:hypothetical protein
LALGAESQPLCLGPQKNSGDRQNKRKEGAEKSAKSLNGVMLSIKNVPDAVPVKLDSNKDDAEAWAFFVKLLILFLGLMILYAGLERWSRSKNN